MILNHIFYYLTLNLYMSKTMKKAKCNLTASMLLMLLIIVWGTGCGGAQKEQAEGEEEAATFVYEIEDIF